MKKMRCQLRNRQLGSNSIISHLSGVQGDNSNVRFFTFPFEQDTGCSCRFGSGYCCGDDAFNDETTASSSSSSSSSSSFCRRINDMPPEKTSSATLSPMPTPAPIATLLLLPLLLPVPAAEVVAAPNEAEVVLVVSVVERDDMVKEGVIVDKEKGVGAVVDEVGVE